MNDTFFPDNLICSIDVLNVPQAQYKDTFNFRITYKNQNGNSTSNEIGIKAEMLNFSGFASIAGCDTTYDTIQIQSLNNVSVKIMVRIGVFKAV